MADVAVLIGPVAIANSETTVYDPTAAQGVVKWLHIANVTGSAATIKMSIGADAAGTRILSDVSIPANDFLDLDVFLPVSTTIRATGGTNNALTITGGAVEL